MLVDQILVEGRVVALEAQLGFDEGAVGLAARSRQLGLSRWPGWGNLIGCAGGHPGGISLELLYAFDMGAYDLAISCGDTFNLAVTGVGLQQSR